MTGLIIVAGIIYVVYALAKDASIKPYPKDMDYRQMTIDRAHGLSTKEIDRRAYSGYYNKKK